MGEGYIVLLPFFWCSWMELENTRLGSMYATAFGAKLMINSIFFFLLTLSMSTVHVHAHDDEPR